METTDSQEKSKPPTYDALVCGLKTRKAALFERLFCYKVCYMDLSLWLLSGVTPYLGTFPFNPRLSAYHAVKGVPARTENQ